MIRSASLVLVLGALAGFDSHSLQAQSTDVIRLNAGENSSATIRGTVLRMNKRNVTIDTSGAERRVEANDIRFVTFSSEPREMRQARTNMIEGRDNRAYEELNSINLDDVSTDFVRMEIDFLKASLAVNMALRGELVTLPEAKLMLSTLLANEQFAENYHYYEAIQLQGDLSYATGNYSDAETQFATLSQLPWPKTALIGSLRVGQSRLGLNKYQDALTSFESVESSELNDTDDQQAKMMARIGKASALAGLDRANEGITILEELIKQQSSDNKPLFAQLYNALGTCYQTAGNPQFAKHNFLHVDLLYYQDPETHAEALFHLVNLWALENKMGFSNDARQKLKDNYPNSIWTSKL